MRSHKVLCYVCTFGAATALLTGCSGGNGQVSFDSGGVTQTFGDEKSASVQNFPLPLYPNAQPKGFVEAKGEGDESSKMLMLESADSTDKIKDYYLKALKDGGWQVSDNSMIPKLANLVAKKDELEANVMISGGETGQATNISMSVSKEPQGALKPSSAAVSTDKLNPPTD